MYDSYEELEGKTVAELRNICRDSGIPGMSKKRKDVIINAILDSESNSGSYDAPATIAKVSEAPKINNTVTGIHGAFQTNITDPSAGKGKRLTTIVKVSAGASTGDFDLAGKTVGAVAEFLKEVLNISSVSKGIVDGEEVKDSYVLEGGESLEFIQPAGTKG